MGQAHSLHSANQVSGGLGPLLIGSLVQGFGKYVIMRYLDP